MRSRSRTPGFLLRLLLASVALLALLPAAAPSRPAAAAAVTIEVTLGTAPDYLAAPDGNKLRLRAPGATTVVAPGFASATTATFNITQPGSYSFFYDDPNTTLSSFSSFLMVGDTVFGTGGIVPHLVTLESVQVRASLRDAAHAPVPFARLEIGRAGAGYGLPTTADHAGIVKIGPSGLVSVSGTGSVEFTPRAPEDSVAYVSGAPRVVTMTVDLQGVLAAPPPVYDAGTFVLPAATKLIRGSVVRRDGTIGNFSVSASREGSADHINTMVISPTTSFTLPVAPGRWNVTIAPDFLAVPPADWTPPAPQFVTFSPVTSTLETQLVTFTVTGPLVQGLVVDPTGAPVPYAPTEIFSPDRRTQVGASTNASGTFKLGGVDASGSYFFMARPSYLSTGSELPSVAIPFSVTFGTSGPPIVTRALPTGTISSPAPFDLGTIQLPAARKLIRATITHAEGKPLGFAYLNASPVFGGGPGDFFSTTGSSITSTMVLTLPVRPGTWNVTPSQSGALTDWAYTGAPQIAAFDLNDVSQTIEISFTVRSTPHVVTGRVVLPNGTPPPDDVVFVNVFDKLNGFGKGEPARNGGIFSVRVPTGTYELDIFSKDPTLGRPSGLQPFSVPPLPTSPSPFTLTMGTITLTQRSGEISGKVKDGSGNGIGGINVSGWNQASGDRVFTTTNQLGEYKLFVGPGRWDVDAFPAPGTPWAREGNVQFIEVKAGDKITGRNFRLARADHLVNVEAVDSSGNLLTAAQGFAFAQFLGDRAGGPPAPVKVLTESFQPGETIGNGRPLQNGKATLNLPDVRNIQITVGFPPGSNYLISQSQPISTTGIASQTVRVTIVEPDAVISGTLKGGGTVIRGVQAKVFANGPGGATVAEVNPATGRYELRVKSGGKVFLGLGIEPGQPWRWNPSGVPEVDLTSTKAASYDFELQATTGKVTGTVTDPDGKPLSGAFVGVSVPPSGTVPPKFMGGMVTGADGTYEVMVTGNLTFEVRASTAPEKGLINPPKADCFVGGAIGATCTANLQFLRPNAVIAGTVYTTTTEPRTGVQAFVRAWSDQGGTAFGRTNASGQYSLNIATGASGDTWHVSGVFQNETQYAESPEYTVAVTPTTTSYSQDLIMGSLKEVPRPMVVTFDATELKIIELSNGVKLTIPAGALATTGQVTVRATPNPALPKGRHARPLDIGYSFEALDSNNAAITRFNANVTLEFPYDPARLGGTSADDITPRYFDTTTGTWQDLDNYTIDKDSLKVVALVDHFTDFSVMSAAPASYVNYLPVVLNTYVSAGW